MTWTNALTTSITRTGTAIALGLSLAAVPAMAVMAQDVAPDAGVMAPAPSFDDATLERFVTAAMDVSEVREDYTLRLQAATSEEDAAALVEDANAAMLAAVEEVDGMDVDTYIAIGEAAQMDAQLAARISEIVEDRTTGG